MRWSWCFSRKKTEFQVPKKMRWFHLKIPTLTITTVNTVLRRKLLDRNTYSTHRFYCTVIIKLFQMEIPKPLVISSLYMITIINNPHLFPQQMLGNTGEYSCIHQFWLSLFGITRLLISSSFRIQKVNPIFFKNHRFIEPGQVHKNPHFLAYHERTVFLRHHNIISDSINSFGPHA